MTLVFGSYRAIICGTEPLFIKVCDATLRSLEKRLRPYNFDKA
jgi:hypothetical protein